MQLTRKKAVLNKFPLRMMPSMRKAAEDFSHKEGVSLNQFINVAVAEKLAHLQHEEWLALRPKLTSNLVIGALEVLDRPTSEPTDARDRIPEGYVSVRRASVKKAK